MRKFQEDRELLPRRVAVAQNRSKKAVAAHEGLGFTLKLDLIVLAELVGVFGHAHIEDGVEFVPVFATQVQGHQFFHLLPAIHLLPVEFSL